MPYIIIGAWDENNVPTRTNTKSTVKDAKEVVKQLKELPEGKACPNAFYASLPKDADIQYIRVNETGDGIVVDDVAKETAEKQAIFNDWLSVMRETDEQLPRYVEDIIDVLPDEQRGNLPQSLQRNYQNKKDVRNRKP